MSISNEKFSAFNVERKSLLSTISKTVSKLNSEMSLALKQQAYMHSDPDSNGSSELIPIISSDVDLIAMALSEVNGKADDLLSVKAGEMTVDQLLTKYPVINLTEYSAELL